MKKRSFPNGIFRFLPLSGFTLSYLFPLLITFVYAFMKSPFERQFHLFGNFTYLLSNRYFCLGFQNFLSLGLVMVLSSILVSLIISPLLCLHPRLSAAALCLLILPLVIPSVSASNVWKTMFETRSILQSGKARFALVSMFVWKYSGIGSVLLYTSLKRIPQSLTDAAKMDGAGPLKTYLFIRLPCIVSEIALTCGVYIMFLMRIYKESYLLFGAYPSQKVYMLQNYMNHQYTNMNFQYVAASAVLLILLSCMLYAFIHFLRARRRWL